MGMPCAVPLAILIDIPTSSLRGRTIGVDRGCAALTVDWYVIGVRGDG